jgi:type IV fimbrial biogenesis protein FimT
MHALAFPSRTSKLPRRARGFTLVEAVTVMAILAILSGVGSAGFVWLNQSTSIRGAAFDLVADLDYARSEAVKRNNDVTVQPVNADWQQGWQIVVGGQVLRSREGVGAQIGFTNAPATLTFDGAGRASLATVRNFQICPPSGGAVMGRVVRIDPSGLSRSTRITCSV